MVTFDYIWCASLIVDILLGTFGYQSLLVCGFQEDRVIHERVAKADCCDTLGAENGQSLISISFIRLFHL